jgi:polysaccharide export outer membrane protein
VLFKTHEDVNPEVFTEALKTKKQVFRYEPYDYFAISIQTNDGEILLDPNREFEIGNAGLNRGFGMGNNQNQNFNNQNNRGNGMFGLNGINGMNLLPISRNSQPPNTYMINSDGSVNLPLIGKVTLTGLSLPEADSVLTERFSKFYVDPYVKSQYLNKRITMIGAMGTRVLPLYDEKLTIIEALSTTGDFQTAGKIKRVRLVRDQSVKLIDLSDVNDIPYMNLYVLPNDILYLEPRRRGIVNEFVESIRTFTVFTSISASLVTTYLLYRQLVSDSNPNNQQNSTAQ